MIEPVKAPGGSDMPLVGPGRMPSPNRNFYRQMDDSRLYTQKYVNMIKGDSDKSTAKFLKMAKFMVNQIQLDTMKRAR